MKTLQLVCHPSWMREELSLADINLKHSYGFEVPYFSYEDIWWLPQSFAVELNKSLVHNNHKPVQFISPGAYLLPSVPVKYSGRVIYVLSAKEALLYPRDGWWKSAEAKIEDFAASYRTKDELIFDIQESNIPDNSLLHFTETTLPIEREFRSFVAHNKVQSTSVYLVNDNGTQTIVYDGAEAVVGDIERVDNFINEMLDHLDVPPSVVVDSAILANGELVLLEFNPSWCSAWYECDIDAVVKTIASGFDLNDNELSRWRYVPDPYLTKKIINRPALPLR